MIRPRFLAVAWVCLFATYAAAQESTPAAEDPVHDELRALRDGFLDAFGEKDIDRMLSYLSDDVVITVQNAEVLRGHDEVLAFHRRMSEGEDRRVQNLQTELEVDELSILYGDDTAVAFGSMDDHFELSNGLEFNLLSRWTATLVRQNDGWKLAAFHVSPNMFDNGVSNMQIKWASIKTGGIAAVAGVLCGAVVGVWWVRRKRETSTSPA